MTLSDSASVDDDMPPDCGTSAARRPGWGERTDAKLGYLNASNIYRRRVYRTGAPPLSISLQQATSSKFAECDSSDQPNTMASDLPGGGKKPRTATPLAWRLVYLAVLSVVGWSFLSNRTASAAIATDVAATQGEIKAMHADVMALRSGYKAALTAESVHPIIQDALEQRLSKVATQISEDMGAHVAKSVATAVGAATRSELEGAVATIEADMRKQLLPQGKQLLALAQLLGELKGELKAEIRHAVADAMANATAALGSAAVGSAATSAAHAAPRRAHAAQEQAAPEAEHAAVHEAEHTAAHEAVHKAEHKAVHEAEHKAVHEAPAAVDAAATHTELTDTVGTPGLGMHAPQAESDAELVAAVGTHAQAHRPSARDIAPGVAHAPESLAVQPAASESEQNPHEEP